MHSFVESLQSAMEAFGKAVAARKASSAFKGTAQPGASKKSVEELVQARLEQMNAERERAMQEHAPAPAAVPSTTPAVGSGGVRQRQTRSLSAAAGAGGGHPRLGSFGGGSMSSEDSLDIEDSLSVTDADVRVVQGGRRHGQRGGGLARNRSTSPRGSQSPPGRYSSIRAPSTADISISDSSLDISLGESSPHGVRGVASRSGRSRSYGLQGGKGSMPAVAEGSGSDSGEARANAAAAGVAHSGAVFWGNPGTPRTGSDTPPETEQPSERGGRPGSGQSWSEPEPSALGGASKARSSPMASAAPDSEHFSFAAAAQAFAAPVVVSPLPEAPPKATQLDPSEETPSGVVPAFGFPGVDSAQASPKSAASAGQRAGSSDVGSGQGSEGDGSGSEGGGYSEEEFEGASSPDSTTEAPAPPPVAASPPHTSAGASDQADTRPGAAAAHPLDGDGTPGEAGSSPEPTELLQSSAHSPPEAEREGGESHVTSDGRGESTPPTESLAGSVAGSAATSSSPDSRTSARIPEAREIVDPLDVAADALVASLQAASVPGISLAAVQAAIRSRAATSSGPSGTSGGWATRDQYRARYYATQEPAGGQGQGEWGTSQAVRPPALPVHTYKALPPAGHLRVGGSGRPASAAQQTAERRGRREAIGMVPSHTQGPGKASANAAETRRLRQALRAAEAQLEEARGDAQHYRAELADTQEALRRELAARGDAESMLSFAGGAAMGEDEPGISAAARQWSAATARFQRLLQAVLEAGVGAVPTGEGHVALPKVQKLEDIPLPGQPLPEHIRPDGMADGRFKLAQASDAASPGEGTVIGWVPLEVARLLMGELQGAERLIQGFQSQNDAVVAQAAQVKARANAASGELLAQREQLQARVRALSAALGVPDDTPLEDLKPPEAAAQATLPAPPPALRRSVEVHDALRRELSAAQDMERERSSLHAKLADAEQDSAGLRVALERERHHTRQLQAELQRLTAGAAASDAAASEAAAATLQRVRDEHAEEVKHLTKKLAWYRENQDMLDRDSARLREQAEQLGEARRHIATLEAALDRSKAAATAGGASAPAARRIRQLERALADAEAALSSRRPDSVAALVHAATAGPDSALAKRAADAEAALEEARAAAEQAEEASARSLRALRQEYERVSAGHKKREARLEGALRSLAKRLGPAGSKARGGLDLERLIGEVEVEGVGASPADGAGPSKTEEMEALRAQAKHWKAQAQKAEEAEAKCRAFFKKKLKEAQAAGGRPGPARAAGAARTRSSQRRGSVMARRGLGQAAVRGRGSAKPSTAPEPAAEEVEAADMRIRGLQQQVALLQEQVQRANAAAVDAVAPSKAIIDALQARLEAAEGEAAEAAGRGRAIAELQGQLKVLTEQNARLAREASKPRSATVMQLEALAAEVDELQRRAAAREAELTSAGAAVRVRAEQQVAQVRQEATKALSAKQEQIVAMRSELDAVLEQLRAVAGGAAQPV